MFFYTSPQCRFHILSPVKECVETLSACSASFSRHARVKAHQCSGAYPGAAGIFWADDTTGNVLSIFPDRIELYYPYRTGATFSMNTVDDYHTYKIVASGPNNYVKVYVDGGTVPVIDTVIPSGQGYDRSWVMFGDGLSGGGSLSSWELVRYRVAR